MKVDTIVVGELDTNCYLLDIDNEVVIIDPGDDFTKIKERIGNRKVVGVLLTHFHFDHIGALEEVLSYYNLEINKVNSNKFKYEIIETPGHTSESKTYYFKNDNIMFIGDFIFKDGIGRTDLGGNNRDMINSLKLISKYPDNTILYTGHGEKTTLKEEKNNFKYYYDI